MLLPVVWIAACVTDRADLPTLRAPMSDIVVSGQWPVASRGCSDHWPLTTDHSFLSDRFHHADPRGDAGDAVLGVGPGLADRAGEEPHGGVEVPEHRRRHPAGDVRAVGDLADQCFEFV